jgi:hypothetical protein
MLALWAMIACFGNGCAALTNPVADGVPARRVPPELLEPSKAGEQTILPTLLAQPRPANYRLDTGDVLGVYVDGFLGEQQQPGIPIHVGPLVQARDQHVIAPSAGYPVPIEEDGGAYLPGVGSVKLRGLSLADAREAIRNAYIEKRLLREDSGRIVVSLMSPRHYQVVILRQEASAFNATLEGPQINSKRGTGFLIDLPAYENDVLHALVQSGGLPGLDAYNEVIICRGGYRPGMDIATLPNVLEAKNLPAGCPGGEVIRIPLRAVPGSPLPFGPNDVVLQTGDVVFLEARDEQVFFTGGLLPPGQYILPRDQDLDVVEAVSRVRGPLFNGAFGGSNLSGALIQPGIGNPSPSLLVVLRRTPGGGQVPIVVDLREALKHPEERILVKAGDVLMLQERPGEAVARYMSQTFLNFDVAWEFLHSAHSSGVMDVAAPERLPQRVFTINQQR